MLIERHLEHLFVLTTKHQQFTLECDALFQPRLCGFHQVLKRLILTALIDEAGQLVGVPQPLELVLQETVLAGPASHTSSQQNERSIHSMREREWIDKTNSNTGRTDTEKFSAQI